MSIIALRNVSKKYHMGRVFVPAVKNVNFNIEKGEFAAISGPSGSGKSTLLNLMGLIDLPSSGEIILDGINVYEGFELPDGNKIPAKLDRRITALRSTHLGFIFQNFNLVPVLNVYENVELPLDIAKSSAGMDLKMNRAEREEWINYLIETVGLTAWKTHKPSELSGGQRQRVAIARALVTKAPLIMADEPTANLDSKNGEQILELMKKLNSELNTTFVFSTHDQRIVKMCNHVIYILDGEQINEEKK
ncbi:MAG: ABC transporter ATP-binding protein [Treponema sp.]|nr:ABC transporter ATP-binding protein [Treponema sp.]